MKVTLVALTQLNELPHSIRGTKFSMGVVSDRNAYHYEDLPNDADTLAHFAGRACYQSWEKPNPDTRTDEGYIANIIKQQHFSVLEHASATFYIEGVSRNLTHELIRHRHLSFSEMSQRYVNMEDAEIVVPPAVDSMEPVSQWVSAVGIYGNAMSEAVDKYSKTLVFLEEKGFKGKSAREAARGLLPGGTETKIVVTGNHRAWREMLQKRYSLHADAEIRQLAIELLKQLKEIAPATYQDFPDSPFN